MIPFPPFQAYSSIENHTHGRTIQTILDVVKKHPTLEWVATEKVHGSNFQMTTNGHEIKCGKRHSFLKDDENFYQFKTVSDKYTQAMFQLLREVQKLYPDLQTIVVYGELFGGIYPHKDVTPVPNVSRVQKNIYYCPHLDFYAFDIYMPDHNRFLPYDICVWMWSLCGFLYAKSLRRGPFSELYETKVENLSSWIPAHFNLPEMKHNLAEGIVIKPVQPVDGQYSELFVKKKQTKFMEVTSGGRPVHNTPLNLNVTVDEVLLQDIERYVTYNRLDNIKSKHGLDLPKKRLAGLLLVDAVDDWKKVNPNKIETMDKLTKARFYERVSKLCTDLIQ
jgi:Rnl2 family RNA ligase